MNEESEEEYIFIDEVAQSNADSITLLRILDTLYAILLEQNEDVAKKLIDLHSEGGLIGPQIAFNPDKMIGD